MSLSKMLHLYKLEIRYNFPNPKYLRLITYILDLENGVLSQPSWGRGIRWRHCCFYFMIIHMKYIQCHNNELKVFESKWANSDDIQYGVNSLRLGGLQLTQPCNCNDAIYTIPSLVAYCLGHWNIGLNIRWFLAKNAL